jgi:hypothetical protein
MGWNNNGWAGGNASDGGDSGKTRWVAGHRINGSDLIFLVVGGMRVANHSAEARLPPRGCKPSAAKGPLVSADEIKIPPQSGSDEEQRASFADDFRRFFTRGLAARAADADHLGLLLWAWNFLWESLGQYIIWLVKWTWLELVAAKVFRFSRRGISGGTGTRTLYPFRTRLLGVTLAMLAGLFCGGGGGESDRPGGVAGGGTGVMRIPLVRAIYPAVKQVTDFVLEDHLGAAGGEPGGGGAAARAGNLVDRHGHGTGELAAGSGPAAGDGDGVCAVHADGVHGVCAGGSARTGGGVADDGGGGAAAAGQRRRDRAAGFAAGSDSAKMRKPLCGRGDEWEWRVIIGRQPIAVQWRPCGARRALENKEVCDAIDYFVPSYGSHAEPLRSYAEQKATKLTKYYDRVREIEVVFDAERKTRCAWR